MHKTSHIEAILWDKDGTLSDTEPLHCLAYQQVVSTLGASFTEQDYRQFLGVTDRVIIETLIGNHQLSISPEQLLAEKEALLIELIKKRATLRPGVLKLLKAAQRLHIKCAVASSATLGAIELVLSILQIGNYFQAIASGEEVAHSKPTPDVFLLAAQRLNVPPERCLVIEDSLNGVLAAKAAGMYCLAVACESTKYQDHSAADLRLDTLDQLILTETGELITGTGKIVLSAGSHAS